jgi:hypothetical protein
MQQDQRVYYMVQAKEHCLKGFRIEEEKYVLIYYSRMHSMMHLNTYASFNGGFDLQE